MLHSALLVTDLQLWLLHFKVRVHIYVSTEFYINIHIVEEIFCCHLFYGTS